MNNQEEAKKAKDKGIRHNRAIALDRSKHQVAVLCNVSRKAGNLTSLKYHRTALICNISKLRS